MPGRPTHLLAVSVGWVLMTGLLAGCDENSAADESSARVALPDVPYCDPARAWPERWTLTEAHAVDLIAAFRERGGDCGEKGRGSAAPAIRLNGALSCAARIHAIAMAEEGLVAHTAPSEIGTAQRLEAVGYKGEVLEHLAAGPQDAEQVVDGVWRPSDYHCIDLLSAKHIDVGLGFVGETEPGTPYETYWVLLLGNPPGPNP
ncbi:MAG: hypothetical protein JKY37_34030 [Nannocystaceae bacterium]|nr:hypothetical protein [Nannocystaceae bacterium]